ncbi:MAG: TRAP transporter small permease [Deltaproteobacteria bacterium]|nr:TRAP transporter small permease [Deltaproteobacteria bacterium]
MSVLRKLLDGLSSLLWRVTGWAVVTLAVVVVGSLLISVFFRYGVGQALSWPEEICMIAFAWLTLLSGSLGVRENYHVRLTLLVDRLPDLAADLLAGVTTAAVAFFGLVLVYSGYDLVTRTAENLTATLRLPVDWINWSAPVCGGLIFIHAVANLVTIATRGGRS